MARLPASRRRRDPAADDAAAGPDARANGHAPSLPVEIEVVPGARAQEASLSRGASGFLPRTFDSFSDREFRWFYIAMLGQMAAMNMQMVIRPYLAFVLTGSYAVLGTVALAGGMPQLFLSPFGGVIADRLPKRTVLQIGQFLSLANAAGLALLVFAGMMRIEWLVASAVAQGIVMALTMPSRQSMIPDIVGLDRMMNAVALNQAGMNTMRLFAPALGGFIVGVVGFGIGFGTMAALYGLAAIALARVTWQPAVAPGEAGMSAKRVATSSLRDIRLGFGYIAREPRMRALLAVSFISSIFGMPYLFLLPGYVADIFGGDATDAGLLISVSAVGSLAGALVLASMPNRRRGLTLLLGTMVLAIGLFAFAQTASYWAAAGFIVIVGVGSSFRQALSQGLLHAYVDNAYRGRVMSVFMMQFSMMQVGTFAIGIAADSIGIRTSFAILGIGLAAVTAFVFLFVPQVRKLD